MNLRKRTTILIACSILLLGALASQVDVDVDGNVQETGTDIADECEKLFGAEAIEACRANVKIAYGTSADGKPPTATAECLDRRDVCPEWAANGECDESIGWMIMNW
jgi:hypothetical protein